MKFRVISDLHVDFNESFPLSLDDDVFTIVCGDTSGNPATTIQWIKENISHGILVSGNHLPYGNADAVKLEDYKTMQEQRQMLADAFPLESDVTYLDVETGVFKKEVDGVLFVGTCMYTDFGISHPVWNPSGDRDFNMMCSKNCICDYSLGITSKVCPVGDKFTTPVKFVGPSDYFEWFKNAYWAIDNSLYENEESGAPKPAVVVTHYPLITDFLKHSTYVVDPDTICDPLRFNWASYASSQQHLLLKHPSVKAHVCGHIHNVHEDWKKIELERQDGNKVLVVNNARGYITIGDKDFNPNVFINTDSWLLES